MNAPMNWPTHALCSILPVAPNCQKPSRSTADEAPMNAPPADRPADRIEKDSLGDVHVPADRLWGAQTQRSIANFPIGVPRFAWGRTVIQALGIVKAAAAEANRDLGQLAAHKAERIVAAAGEAISGQHAGACPRAGFRTGSATQ